MIHATCCRSRGFRYDKLGDSIIVLERVEGDSKEQRSSSDQGSPEESLSFREENFLPPSLPRFSYFLYLFISLSLASASSEDLSLSWSSSSRSRLLHGIQVGVYRTANYDGGFIAYLAERFLSHLTLWIMNFMNDYESSRVTRVSARDGSLRTAAIAGRNLRNSPPVYRYLCCAHVQELKTYGCPIYVPYVYSQYASFFSLNAYTYTYNLSNIEIVFKTKISNGIDSYYFIPLLYIFVIIPILLLFSDEKWLNYWYIYISDFLNISLICIYKSFQKICIFPSLSQKYYISFSNVTFIILHICFLKIIHQKSHVTIFIKLQNIDEGISVVSNFVTFVYLYR